MWFKDPHSRRFFLKGAGGIVLALPFMESLLSRRNYAMAAGATPKRFLSMMNSWGQPYNLFFPTIADSLMTSQGNGVRTYPLANLNGNMGEVLGTNYSSNLIGQMNFIDGLDIVTCRNHNTWSGLGPDVGVYNAKGDSPVYLKFTLDQALANSSKVYPNGSAPTRTPRSMVLQPRSTSEVYNAPSFASGNSWSTTVSGQRNMNTALWDPAVVLDQFFQGTTTTGSATLSILDQRKKLAIDGLQVEIAALRSNSRLSALDKNRLDEYVAQISDIQRGLQATVPAVTCTKPTLDALRTGETALDRSVRNHTKLIMQAFQCGIVNVASVLIEQSRVDLYRSIGLVHGDTHGWDGVAANLILDRNVPTGSRYLQLAKLHGKYFRIMAEALTDAVDTNGARLTDSTLFLWTNEFSSSLEHLGFRMPIVTVGNLQSKFQTGKYIDYRRYPYQYHTSGNRKYALGRQYSNLLVSICKAFGMTDAEIEVNGTTPGFGDYLGYAISDFKAYYREYDNDASRRATLPYLYRG